MNLIPYSKVKTENLSLLLFTARTTGLIGVLLLILDLFFLFTVLLVASDLPMGGSFGNIVKYFSYGVLLSLAFFASSGVLAALVSFEYTYTKKNTL